MDKPIPEAVAAEAAALLTKWLDSDECECEPYGHSCGRPDVIRVRDDLLALTATQQQGQAVALTTVRFLDGGVVQMDRSDYNNLITAPPSAPVGVEGLDLELIAEMLEAYEQHTRCGLDLAHVESSILEQAALLREASERDAAGVHTALAQQPAAVDDARRVMYELCDCPNGRAEHAEWCAALAAQPGGSDNDQ